MSTRLQAVLFDLDGVIIDSEGLHERAIRQTADYLGRPIDEAGLDRFKGLVEARCADLLIEWTGSRLTNDEVVTYRDGIYREMFDAEIQPVAGALEFVRRCREGRGLRLALATSALPSNQERAFARFALAPFFETVVTSADVRRGKPDPEPYLLAASRLGADPAACLVVEDSVNGVRSGKAAGCLVAGLTTTFAAAALREAGADVVADTFAGIDAWIDGGLSLSGALL